MADDLSAQLASVQTAIRRVEAGGQDVTYDGRRVTYGDLATLYKREESLKRQIGRAGRGGMRVRYGVAD